MRENTRGLMSLTSAVNLKFRDHIGDVGAVDVCERPYVVEAWGVASKILPSEQGKKDIALDVPTRCRKCAPCLRFRRRVWTAKAVMETNYHERTWFGTLTVSPENRMRLAWEVEKARLSPSNELLCNLTRDEQFRYLASALGKEVTKFLKRLRKKGAGFRYLLVFEAHKDGFPHVHMLLHEVGEPITKKRLEADWNHGFSSWRLVERESKAAVYVCKYLAKDALCRVRASKQYGRAFVEAVVAKDILGLSAVGLSPHAGSPPPISHQTH